MNNNVLDFLVAEASGIWLYSSRKCDCRLIPSRLQKARTADSHSQVPQIIKIKKSILKVTRNGEAVECILVGVLVMRFPYRQPYLQV